MHDICALYFIWTSVPSEEKKMFLRYAQNKVNLKREANNDFTA